MGEVRGVDLRSSVTNKGHKRMERERERERDLACFVILLALF